MPKPPPFAPWNIDPPPLESGPITVAGPPCVHCRHWRPCANVIESSVQPGIRFYDGVTLCHADEQFRDFSCYRPKDTT